MSENALQKSFKDLNKPTRMRMCESARRLRELNFDPLEEQVILFHQLRQELRIYERIREGKMVQLTSDGNERVIKYSAVAHAAIFAQMQKIANDLMRYKYGRIPETLEVELREVEGLTIVLEKEDGSFQNIKDA